MTIRPPIRMADNEFLYCAAVGIRPAELTAKLGVPAIWQSLTIARICGRAGLQGRPSTSRMLAGTVAAGLPEPPSDLGSAQIAVVLKLAELLRTDPDWLPPGVRTVCQRLIDGLAPEELGKQPDLFDAREPMTGSAVRKWGRTYAAGLGLRQLAQLVLAGSWAGIFNTPPLQPGVLGLHEQVYLQARLQGDTIELASEETRLAANALYRLTAGLCGRLGCEHIAQAVVAGLRYDLVSLPEELEYALPLAGTLTVAELTAIHDFVWRFATDNQQRARRQRTRPTPDSEDPFVRAMARLGAGGAMQTVAVAAQANVLDTGVLVPESPAWALEPVELAEVRTRVAAPLPPLHL